MKHPETAPRTVHDTAKKQKRNNSVAKSHSSANSKSIASSIERDELIRQMAYTLYEARSCVSGHELDDWLQAEVQVDQILTQGVPVFHERHIDPDLIRNVR